MKDDDDGSDNDDDDDERYNNHQSVSVSANWTMPVQKERQTSRSSEGGCRLCVQCLLKDAPVTMSLVLSSHTITDRCHTGWLHGIV